MGTVLGRGRQLTGARRERLFHGTHDWAGGTAGSADAAEGWYTPCEPRRSNAPCSRASPIPGSSFPSSAPTPFLSRCQAWRLVHGPAGDGRPDPTGAEKTGALEKRRAEMGCGCRAGGLPWAAGVTRIVPPERRSMMDPNVATEMEAG